MVPVSCLGHHGPLLPILTPDKIAAPLRCLHYPPIWWRYIVTCCNSLYNYDTVFYPVYVLCISFCLTSPEWKLHEQGTRSLLPGCISRNYNCIWYIIDINEFVLNGYIESFYNRKKMFQNHFSQVNTMKWEEFHGKVLFTEQLSQGLYQIPSCVISQNP